MEAHARKTGAQIKKEMGESRQGDTTSSEDEFPYVIPERAQSDSPPPPDPDEAYQGGDDDSDWSVPSAVPHLEEVEEEDFAPIMYIPALPPGPVQAHVPVDMVIPPPQLPKEAVGVGSFVVPITVAFVFFLVASQL